MKRKKTRAIPDERIEQRPQILGVEAVHLRREAQLRKELSAAGRKLIQDNLRDGDRSGSTVLAVFENHHVDFKPLPLRKVDPVASHDSLIVPALEAHHDGKSDRPLVVFALQLVSRDDARRGVCTILEVRDAPVTRLDRRGRQTLDAASFGLKATDRRHLRRSRAGRRCPERYRRKTVWTLGGWGDPPRTDGLRPPVPLDIGATVVREHDHSRKDRRHEPHGSRVNHPPQAAPADLNAASGHASVDGMGLHTVRPHGR